ncbi:MAG: hypothetical protein KF883_15885 [Thermomicrobiales bacterium]|nr:hypothetical protein [Thermomicrobiales bacterium]
MTTDQEQSDGPNPDSGAVAPQIPDGSVVDAETPEPPVGRGSSHLVKAALAAGAVVLALLLLIVWLSSRNDSGGRLPLCLDITAERAAEAVLAGEVEQVDVLLDQEDPLKGLTAIQLQLADGECRRLPEGADNRDGLYQLLGAVSLYNAAGGGQRIDVDYLRQEVPTGLLSTSTPERSPTAEPSPTTEPSATVAPSATSSPTSTPTEAATATTTTRPDPTATTAESSPAASPAAASPMASPVGSPVASPISSATPSPSPTP